VPGTGWVAGLEEVVSAPCKQTIVPAMASVVTTTDNFHRVMQSSIKLLILSMLMVEALSQAMPEPWIHEQDDGL